MRKTGFQTKALGIALAAAMLAGCGGSGKGASPADTGTSTEAGGAGETVGQNTPAADVGGVDKSNTETSDETLTVVLMAEPTTITGLNGVTTESSLIISECIGGTLLEYDDGEVTPSLASGYEAIDDTHYRFTIRDEACYSDGTPVTAQDVVYSYGCYQAGGASAASYFNMEETVAEDDKNVIVAFQSYVPGWEYLIAEGNLPIYSEAAVEAVGGLESTDLAAPTGCGRYVLSEWKTGEYVMLERNENYWDTDYTPYYKYIKFIGIGDAASRLLAVQSGDANVAYKITATDYIALEANPDVNGVIISDDDLYNLGFNCTSEKLKDPKVREALTYAVDAEAVNALVNMGRGKVAQGLFPENFPYYHEVYEGGHLPFDPAKAKELLAQAGYPDGLTLRFITLAANQSIATIIQESMRQAGVTVEIDVLEQSVYVQEARSGNYDLQIISSSLGSVQPNCFNAISSRQMGKAVGQCRLNDPAMDELCDLASSPDPAVQGQAFGDIIDYVFNNYCLVGLCTQNKYCGVTAGIDGLTTGTRMSYIDVSYMHK